MPTNSRHLNTFVTRRRDLLLFDASMKDSTATPWFLAPFSQLWNSLMASGGFGTQPKIPPSTIFDTKYGLRVMKTEEAGESDAYSIVLVPSRAHANTAVSPHQQNLHHYRIFPDWMTSCLWKDMKYSRNRDENPMLDDEHTTSWYPPLASYFFDWRNVFKTEIERQGIHLGSGEKVFDNPKECVAWCTEGFMMACWLVLQQDVETVEYCLPNRTAYNLKKDNLNRQLHKFLVDIETLHGNAALF
ncbi:hypothetical protein F4779DRAFT_635726 [Xylariaceae sp. FL0662B]|nr:hypothetical protein F4779DRAFT_635726 [Xylariaceae sp. FL0662B]